MDLTNPDAPETIHSCARCGHAVSVSYYRVFSIEGTLHNCLHCHGQFGNHAPGE